LQKAYLADPSSKLPQDLLVSNSSGPYTLSQGIIYYKSRVWLGNAVEIQQQVLFTLHTSALRGHSGYEATYHRVKKLFAWPQLKQSVKDYVAKCTVCQQAKTERVAYP
jgi:hypothetical protein